MCAKPKQTKHVNSVFKGKKLETFHSFYNSLPQNWRLVFHHLEIKWTACNIHLNRNVHGLHTFNLDTSIPNILMLKLHSID